MCILKNWFYFFLRFISETSKRSPSQTTNRNKLLPGRQTLHTSLVIPPVRSKSWILPNSDFSVMCFSFWVPNIFRNFDIKVIVLTASLDFQISPQQIIIRQDFSPTYYLKSFTISNTLNFKYILAKHFAKITPLWLIYLRIFGENRSICVVSP